MKAMEYRDVTGGEIGYQLESDMWVAQQKFDGTRVLFDLRAGETLTRKGAPLKFAAAKQHVDAIWADLKRRGIFDESVPKLARPQVYLDGELIVESGRYILFDMWDESEPNMTYIERMMWLKSLPIDGTMVELVTTTWTENEKRDLLKRLEAAGVEGMMLKRTDGRYEPGRRVDTSIKVKFVKSAEVVVIGTSTSPLSAKLGILDNGSVKEVGNCSLIGKSAVEPGDVIEVNYLFWTGTKLYQPRMMRTRPDKTLIDCPIDQLPEYSRKVVRQE